MANAWLVGVFLSTFPADVNDGAKGECVPAELINDRARVRWLAEDEVDDAWLRGRHGT